MNDRSPSPAQLTAQKKLTAAYRATYAIAALLLVVGIIIALARESAPMGADVAIAMAISCFIFGALYLLLGFFIQRRSQIALGIAIGLMLVNLLSAIAATIQTGNVAGLFIPLIYLSQTWEGFKAIRELKRN